MKTDRRIQVYLPERDYKTIQARARQDGKSMAGLLRDAARQYVAQDEKARIREGYRVLSGIIGIGRDKEGKTDVAERHDYYLNQGTKGNKWKW